MVTTDDLAAAFEKAGLYGLHIHRRSKEWGSVWVVDARFDGNVSDKDARIFGVTGSDLKACLDELMTVNPRRLPKGHTVVSIGPKPGAADDLSDLL